MTNVRAPSPCVRGWRKLLFIQAYRQRSSPEAYRATQGAMEHERRRTRRVPIQSKVRLKIGAEELIGETVDVTMSGILVRASRVVPVGSSLRMSLQLSQRMRPIMASGSVVRILAEIRWGFNSIS